MALIWAVCVVTGGVTPCAGSPSLVHCAGVFVLVVCVCFVSLWFVRECVHFWSVCVNFGEVGFDSPTKLVSGGPRFMVDPTLRHCTFSHGLD